MEASTAFSIVLSRDSAAAAPLRHIIVSHHKEEASYTWPGCIRSSQSWWSPPPPHCLTCRGLSCPSTISPRPCFQLSLVRVLWLWCELRSNLPAIWNHSPAEEKAYSPTSLIHWRADKYYTIDINGRHDTVSLDRLKPAHCETKVSPSFEHSPNHSTPTPPPSPQTIPSQPPVVSE